MQYIRDSRNGFFSLAMACLLTLPVSAAFSGEKYSIDAAHTTTEFAVRHMVISTVKGSFPDVSGEIVYDEEDITRSTVDVRIKVASVNTNNDKRDEHLRSPEFFDAEKYPEITFKSKKIEKNKEGHMLTGILTIRDVSKEVTFPFELTGKVTDPWGSVRIGAEASLKINRQEFGVAWNKVLEGGGLVVGNDVKINISLEAVKK